MLFRSVKLLFIVMGLLFFAPCPILFSQNNNTTPQAPKNKTDPADRMLLSNDVPHPIEAYKFKVTGTWGGTEYFPAQVPYWSINQGMYKSGELAVGTDFVPEKIRAIGGRHFYGFIKKEKLGDRDIEKTYWVDGNFLEVASGP